MKEIKEKLDKKINDLDGATWLRYSISIWSDVNKTKEEIELNHPAMFPKELPKRLIKIFLKENEKEVLDPFMGVGSTLIAAKELSKHGIGFEISEEYVKIAEKRLKNQELFDNGGSYTIYLEDARNLDKYISENTIDICITSPPYWDILSEKRTADMKPNKNYSEENRNLGMIKDYKEFLKELMVVFEKVYKVLKPNKFCIVNVMDIRKKNKFYPFHMDLISHMQEIGFELEDIIIWDRRKDYNNLRPLGYPFVFRVNKVHEYLLIFKKPKVKKVG